MNPRNRNNVKKASMGPNLQNISPKKMIAFALMSVMGILWARVLLTGKNSPQAAKAAQEQAAVEAMAAVASAQQPAASVRVARVELPVLPGRNDVITHNPFSADNWNAFEFHQRQEVEPAKVIEAAPTENSIEKRHQANIKRISERLTLEGVICDSRDVPFQAFVDGKILTVGSLLMVKEGPDKYELILKTIEEKEVQFIWNDLTVVLKMTETVEH